MAAGLGVMRLSPRDFWAMTPREFAAACEGLFGTAHAPLARDELDDLMSRFPD
jgi:uncharacterized phage protein (TIGR02216 family)